MKRIIFAVLFLIPIAASAQTEAKDSLVTFRSQLRDVKFTAWAIAEWHKQGNSSIVDALTWASENKTIDTGYVDVILTQEEVIKTANILSGIPHGAVKGTIERLESDIMPLLPLHPYLMSEFISLTARNQMASNSAQKSGLEIMNQKIKAANRQR